MRLAALAQQAFEIGSGLLIDQQLARIGTASPALADAGTLMRVLGMARASVAD